MPVVIDALYNHTKTNAGITGMIGLKKVIGRFRDDRVQVDGCGIDVIFKTQICQ